MVLVGILEFAGMVVGLYNTCFTGDTLVATEDGRRRIDQIKVGDKVWAYNPDTGEKELKEVVNVFVKETDEILHLETTDGTIDTTTTHPFYVVGEGWKAAGDLKAGDEIYALDGSAVTILSTSLEKLDEPIKVYNLEVADFHTYFVGNTGMLVHNRCGGSGSKETGSSGAESSSSGGSGSGNSSSNSGGVGNPVNSKGNGSTGKITPNNLKEQMAMHQVKSDPLRNARELPFTMNDSRWPGSEGWVKMESVTRMPDGSKVTIHFNYNTVTGAFDDFKFEN